MSRSFAQMHDDYLDPDKHDPSITMEQERIRRDQMIMEIIQTEREFQDLRAKNKDWKTDKTLGEWLLVIDAELTEAKLGWIKDKGGRDHPLHELVQIAAVAVAALEQLNEIQLHGLLQLSEESRDEAARIQRLSQMIGALPGKPCQYGDGDDPADTF
jgi:hypothetical protein